MPDVIHSKAFIQPQTLEQLVKEHLHFKAAYQAANRHLHRVLKRDGKAPLACLRPFLARNYPDVDADTIIGRIREEWDRRIFSWRPRRTPRRREG